jgi:hypothetical protein
MDTDTNIVMKIAVRAGAMISRTRSLASSGSS